MQAGVVGGSNQEYSLPFNAERTINMHVVLDQQGKKPSSLYSRAGNALFATVGNGAGRGGFASSNGRCFIVSGASIYEIFSVGTSALIGTIDSASGDITIAENGIQLAICDGTSLYIFTYATNNFQKVTSANLPSASTVCFLGGYFIVSKAPNSGIFQISAPYDGLTWAALDFATAESSPDNLLRVMTISGQLFLFGGSTVEIWSNTGAASFPFRRVNSAAVISVGTSSPYSVDEIDNSTFWIGKNIDGDGIVYRADGLTPIRISTEFVERRLQAVTDKNSLKGMSYQEAGHVFYIITGGGMETALVYDISTKVWAEWAYLNSDGAYELPLTSYLLYAFGKTLSLDRANGNIYHLSQDYHSDNGEEIARDRIFTHIFDNGNPFLIKNLVINFETGVGNSECADPKAMLYLSNNGGRSFYAYYEKALGKIGEYLSRVVFWRLGRYRQLTFRLRITDKVKVVITGGQFNQ
jgi:hypothetical protein